MILIMPKLLAFAFAFAFAFALAFAFAPSLIQADPSEKSLTASNWGGTAHSPDLWDIATLAVQLSYSRSLGKILNSLKLGRNSPLSRSMGYSHTCRSA